MSVNLDLLRYIVSKHSHASITSLMKLAYLIDLVSISKHGKRISKFKFKRDKFGPFDPAIYKMLGELTRKELITGEGIFSDVGEYVIYSSNEVAPDVKLTTPQGELIDEVLSKLRGHGAKALTEIAYSTKPMKALNATMGGNEGIGEVLDLDLVKSD